MISNISQTKLLAALISIIVGAGALGAQSFVFPPELQWWLDEARKANPSISLDGFVLDGSESATVPITKIAGQGGIYPVLKKWNYSGDRYAYYDLYAELIRNKDGRYELSRDIDSAMGIFDRSGAELYSESFGSSKGLNALAWIRDGVLVAAGIWLDFGKEDKTTVRLIIREYSLSDRDVRVREFAYPDAFDSSALGMLRLNWWEQRRDYFSP